MAEQGTEHHFTLAIRPEKLRLVSYLSFFILIAIGAALTQAFADFDPERTVIKGVFGYNNVCLYFDYPPASYIVPTLWNVFLLTWVGYIGTVFLRSKQKFKQGKISKALYQFVAVTAVFETLASFYFIQCFVSKPEGQRTREAMAADPTLSYHDAAMQYGGIGAHMHPFTIFIVAINTMTLKNCWYFTSIENGIKGVKARRYWLYVGFKTLLTFQKVLTHFNVFLGEPMWIADREDARIVGGVLDKIWVLVATVIPVVLTYVVEYRVGDIVLLQITCVDGSSDHCAPQNVELIDVPSAR